MTTARDRPPKDEKEWEDIWSGINKAHAGWPVVKVMLAIFSNWKIICAGVILALVFGGKDLLSYIGVSQ